MPCLVFSPTFNSLTVRWCAAEASSEVSRRKRDVGRCSDPLLRALGPHLHESVVSCPLQSPHRPFQLTLHSCGAPGPPEADGDSDSGDGDDAARDDSKLSGSQELQQSAESVAFFGFLEAGRPYAVIVSAGDSTEEHIDAAEAGNCSSLDRELVCIAGSHVGIAAGMSKGLFSFRLCVNVLDEGGARQMEVDPSRVAPISQRAMFAFNFQTLPGFPGLPPRISRSLLLPIDSLGPWLLDLRGNYAYATSLAPDFLVALFEHGLFVLPGDRQIFSCPFPVKPFVFQLQELPSSSWRGKMLRRYGKDFELSCNCNFQEHLRLCGQYHEDKGGTWINSELIAALVEIHRDGSNGVRVYCFELWDKATGELAAASFGLRIGAFFHDFSMCCLVKDRRSAGSILTKAIGALLTDCGVRDWYWGCKMEYMAEYEAHGAQEVTRQEYYQRLRSSIREELPVDPSDAISAGRCLIKGRACGTV
eukprot:gb/GFBE01017606.1/.p1 GENE.gb/GFBE01017606.1/~~gb/GFBE01017606.1/.p1  ORF type:complete len:475 (+),score=88.74 gb/GFBE01017606.1/:1-1425(+)